MLSVTSGLSEVTSSEEDAGAAVETSQSAPSLGVLGPRQHVEDHLGELRELGDVGASLTREPESKITRWSLKMV